jgi:hypothetical protein
LDSTVPLLRVGEVRAPKPVRLAPASIVRLAADISTAAEHDASKVVYGMGIAENAARIEFKPARRSDRGQRCIEEDVRATHEDGTQTQQNDVGIVCRNWHED